MLLVKSLDVISFKLASKPDIVPEPLRFPLTVVLVAVIATVPSVEFDILSPLPKLTSLPVTAVSYTHLTLPTILLV